MQRHAVSVAGCSPGTPVIEPVYDGDACKTDAKDPPGTQHQAGLIIQEDMYQEN